MRETVRIYKNGFAYLGMAKINRGFIGEAEMIPNEVALLIIKPKTSMKDVKRSVELILQGIEFQMEMQKDAVEQKDNQQNITNRPRSTATPKPFDDSLRVTNRKIKKR